MKNKLKFLAIILIPFLLYALTTRGSVGNPTPAQIDYSLSSTGRAFETSQERSRWALILSLYQDHKFFIDKHASMGTPDVGFIHGHYFSFFPPGMSVFALPLFALGTRFGVSQILTFSTSTIFAFLTLLILYKFCRRLKLPLTICLFSALAFGFATNAWGYSVTLYAHLASAFFLLLGLYLTLFSPPVSFIKALAVWLLYSLAVFFDFPNLFLFFPVVAILTLQAFSVKDLGTKFSVHLRIKYLLAPIIFITLMGIYGYYNYVNFGSPITLSNTLPRVRDLKQTNALIDKSIPQSGETAASALRPRSLMTGLYSFIFSRDRGLIYYSPIVLLSLVGLIAVRKKITSIILGLFALPVFCLVLYSMFGDPYGGWAFGSRYLITTAPELIILAGIGLHHYSRSVVIKIIYTLVFIYSCAISLLAPLTTNVIPPFVEARYINLDSTYIINWRMLLHSQLNSFLYNLYFHKFLSGLGYYFLILIPLVIFSTYLIWKNHPTHDHQ